MADTVLANLLGKSQPVQSANAWAKKYFPVNADYSIVNDLSFLALPSIEMAVEPIVRNGIANLGIQDKDIPDYAAKIAKAALDKAHSEGSVTLFNTIELEESDLQMLVDLLAKNLPITETAKYEVIE